MSLPEILPGAKVPGFLLLDFETRSELELKDVGVWRYAEHPSTEWLCVAASLHGATPEVFQNDGRGHYAIEAWAHDGRNYPILAYNAEFEYAMLRRFFPKSHITPDRIFDLSAWCAAYGLPGSLDDVGNALGLTHKKDLAGHRLMLRMCKPLPEKEQLRTGKKWADSPEELQALRDYCRKDIDAEFEVASKVPPLSADEQANFTRHLEINERGILLDHDLIDGALIAMNWASLRRKKKLAENFPDVNPNSRPQVLKFCKDRGVETGFTKEEIALTLERTDIPEEVRLLLTIRKESGKTSLGKYGSMAERSGKDGRIRGNYRFHGATRTGRWAGQGAQFQNVSRGNLKPAVVEERIKTIKAWTPELLPDFAKDMESCLRGTIISKPGHDLACADYAAVEARLVLWLAGELDGLKLFSDFDAGIGPEPYIVMASRILNKDLKDVNSIDRQLGKQAILGAGFGLGGRMRLNKDTGVWEKSKFQLTCEKYKIAITPELAERSINIFRQSNPLLVEFWDRIQKAAWQAMENPGTIILCGKIAYKFDGQTLRCRLPSGRVLTYFSAEYDGREVTYMSDGADLGSGSTTKAWHRRKLTMMTLVENATQATSACLLRNAIRECQTMGWPVVMHTHDELMVEVPEGTVTAKEFEAVITRKPAWAEGLPLVAKGWVGKRYRKD